jgi:thiol:disulfide interchange protein DsbD
MPCLARVAALVVIAWASSPATAQFELPPSKLPKKFLALADVQLEVVPASAKWGETVTVKLTIDLKPGAEGYTYPFFPKDPGQDSKNTLVLPPPGDLIFIAPLSDPPGLKEKQRDGAPEGVMDQYYDKSVTWQFKAVVSPKATPGKKTLALSKTVLQVCKEQCIRATGDQLPTAAFEVQDGASDRVNPADLAAALDILLGRTKLTPAAPGEISQGNTEPRQPADSGTNGPPPAAVAPMPPPASSGEGGRKPAKPIEVYTADLQAIQAQLHQTNASEGGSGKAEPDLGSFVLTAAAWGLISLITPCVFPMIPITVSIFLKHAHGSFRERIKLATIYCLTIVAVLGVSAFALLKFMAWLAAHPVTNLALAALFLVMALSLFGLYELTLPSFLSRRLQAKQARGGVVGTIFGALAFTVISFTCVAPFLGGFAGISAADSARTSLIELPSAREIAGGLAFATAFAAPFFVLALVPSLMRALPKSGGWLDSVKVVMGFLELAAAMKFLRTAELRIFPTPQYFTYELVLGGWVAISLACGLYLLNLYRLPHDEDRPHIGVVRLLFALLFLGLAAYLLPATFRGADGKLQRPAGAVYAWVEAFLLPEPEAWGTDLKTALEKAKQTNKPVFVDFTGVTCTNCKYNEQSIFPQTTIREQLAKFERVQLYTDEVPAAAYVSDPGLTARKEEAAANARFQVEVFKDGALPLYAVLLPTADGQVKVVGVYDEGKINNPDRFAAWLQAMLDTAKSKP